MIIRVFGIIFSNPNVQSSIQNKWAEINPNGQKSYVRTSDDGKEFSLVYAEKNFTQYYPILFSRDLLIDSLKQMSRIELSRLIGCSQSIIDKKLVEYDIQDFKKRSYYECLISDFLTNHGINFYQNIRSIIPPWELDFYIPDHNLAIEFNGIAWHGEKVNRGKNYHKNKWKLCNDKGIKLIQIFQDEWDDRSNIVKSLLCSNLGLITKKYHARKCSVEVLDSSVAGEFIQTNHLQGVGNGAMIHLGLVMDSNILSVMTFYDHKDSWEIKRFASLPNISIMGAAGKLYNYFLNNYHPNNVFSYSDNTATCI